MKKQSVLIRLGFFIALAVFLFVLVIYILGREQSMFGANFRLGSIFRDVEGLKAGNNIRFSGIDVGTVSGVYILTDSTVFVEMTVDEDVRKFIKKDSRATIGSEGLMGNKVLHILPGNPESGIVEDNDILASVEPVEIDEILKTFQESSVNIAEVTHNLIGITEKINRGEGVFGKLFTDTTLIRNLDMAGRNLAGITGDLSGLSENISSNQGIFGRLLNDTSFAMNMDTVSRNITRISEDFAEIAEEIKRGEGIFGKLFTDTALTSQLGETGERLSGSSKSIENITVQLNEITEKINSGSGLISRLLNDSILADTVEITIGNINQGAEDVSNAAVTVENSWLLRMFSGKKIDKVKGKESGR